MDQATILKKFRWIGRMFAACCFALIGLVLLLTLVGMMMEEKRADLLAEFDDLMVMGCSIFTAIYLFSSKAKWEARIRCPRCWESQVKPSPLWLHTITLRQRLIFGGFHMWLSKLARKTRFDCAACGTGFDRRTWGSLVALTWVVAMTISLLISWSYEVFARNSLRW